MSQSETSPRFLQDFAGRRFTAVAIVTACLASAALNTWGGTMMFPNWITSIVFGVMIGCGEFIAATALRHIVADFENNRYWKARLGTIILTLAIIGCVLSGHKAFSTLFLEADANYKSLEIRSKAAQAEADKYHLKLLAEDSDINRAVWERRQDLADNAALSVLKAEPPHKVVIYFMLALFELVKIGGLYALATPSTKGLSRPQRRAQKRLQKIREAKSQAEYERKLADAYEADDTNVFPIAAKA